MPVFFVESFLLFFSSFFVVFCGVVYICLLTNIYL